MNQQARRIGLVVVAVALAVTACSVSVGGKKYDAGAIEAKLKSSQQGKTGGLPIGDAACPEDVKITEGVTFTCTLAIDGIEAPYKIVLTKVEEDTAHIEIAPAKAIIATSAAAGFVKKNLNSQDPGITVVCGKAGEKLILADPGDTIACTASLGTDREVINLTVKDTQGNVTVAS